MLAIAALGKVISGRVWIFGPCGLVCWDGRDWRGWVEGKIDKKLISSGRSGEKDAGFMGVLVDC